MSDHENVYLDYFYIRQATNGWVITKDGPERGYITTNFWVFRTLDEMFAWIREQVEAK